MKTVSRNARMEAALALHRLGYPVTLCQGKKPNRKGWPNHVYTIDEIRREFQLAPSLNVGIVLGSRSGIIDIECDSEQAELDLLQLFGGEIPHTACYQSKRGRHYLYAWDERFEEIAKAKVLWREVEIRLGANEKGAHSLVPESSTDGFTRSWTTSLEESEPQPLPESVIEKLIERIPQKVKPINFGASQEATLLSEFSDVGRDDRPGDDFNKRGSWSEILTPHGWTVESSSGEVTHWTRPGKAEGVSATTGHCKTQLGKELMYCFSTSAEPLKPDEPYDKFSLYAHLNHGGDFNRAADKLREYGYGKREITARKGAKNKATQLVELASEAELFHTPDDEAYITAPVNGHLETWPVKSDQLNRWLSQQFYLRYASVPGASALKDAALLLGAKACFDGKSVELYTRIGEHGGNIYIDIANDDWQVIEVTSEGWDVIDSSPVKFHRPSGMLELPVPQSGGDISQLKEFINLPDDDFPLLIAAMLAAYRPSGPFPVLILRGEQGCAKSTAARVVRSLCDPNAAPLRAEPKDARDLVIAASNGWLLVYDNLSKVPVWLSDGLCRLSTGGGFSTRELYSDKGETVFNVQRPALLTGIETPTSRADLLDRSLVLELPVIPSNRRCTEADLLQKFELARPTIFGALLDGVSSALRNFSSTRLKESPRMADFARWATAAEEGLKWSPGTFMTAYAKNRQSTNDEVLEDQLALAIRKLMELESLWTGSPTELLVELNKLVDEATRHSSDWPGSPSALSAKLNRLAPCLREAGLSVERPKRSGQARRITLLKKVADSKS